MDNDTSVVYIFGATGLIGQNVVKELLEDGFSIKIFARDPEKSRKLFPQIKNHIKWDYHQTDWKTEIDGPGTVINMSGAPIFQKWKGNYKKEIWDSRVEATKQIVDAIGKSANRPTLLINGSASGIYGYESFDDSEVTESFPAGKDFWGDLVTAWESAALEAEKFGTRVVNIRTSVVLSMEGGALPQLVSVFKKGIGGPISPGDQWFPWIHIDDEVGLIMFAMENDSVSGPLNASAPEVPTMEQFARTLGSVMGKSARIRIPVTIIRLMMGEVANVLAKGRKVVPKRALELGYRFNFGKLEDALKDLMK